MNLFRKRKKENTSNPSESLKKTEEHSISVVSFFPSVAPFEESNQVGYSDGLLVFPMNLATSLLQATEQNPRKIETYLDFPENYLGDAPVMVGIPKNQMHNLRIPSGNEQIYVDLHARWVPGGKRKTGMPEAIIDPVPWDKVFYHQL